MHEQEGPKRASKAGSIERQQLSTVEPLPVVGPRGTRRGFKRRRLLLLRPLLGTSEAARAG